MNASEALVGLNLVGGIAGRRLAQLLHFFDRPQNIFSAPVEKIRSIPGFSGELAARISSFKAEDLSGELKLAASYGLKIVTILDKDYPESLKRIVGAPIVLYVQGELKEEDAAGIAIVGSRRASFYGLSVTERFAFELSRQGVTIVSGLARGVDTFAHRGALKAGGRTLAVLGSGFKHLYPEENIGLAGEIAGSGAVISEFPLDTRPIGKNFPRRNRIISGLSLGVLVTEAARSSGALITADFALEQNKEVFALPGRVDSNTSFGTNDLIKQGAKLVSSVDDILEELALPIVNNCGRFQEDRVTQKAELQDGEERRLYELISKEPIQFDRLMESSGMSIARISSLLLSLRMKKLITQLPGKQLVKQQVTR